MTSIRTPHREFFIPSALELAAVCLLTAIAITIVFAFTLTSSAAAIAFLVTSACFVHRAEKTLSRRR